MSALGRARAWLRHVIARDRSERDMHEEMRAHLEQAEERLLARGMSEPDARRAARLEFGNAAVIQEQARDARGGRWLDSVKNDVRYALRYFARTRLTTAAILFTLTLGIGITASMLTIFTSLMFRPAPGVPDDRALVLIRGTHARTQEGRLRLFSWPELEEYAQLRATFAEVAAWKAADVVADVGDAERGIETARALFVTPNYFHTLGVHLAAGSGFTQSSFDERNAPELTAVVAYNYAMRSFGGVTGAIGRRVKLNGVIVTIVGVAPRPFNGALQSAAPRTVWMPMSAWRVLERPSVDVFSNRDSSYFRAIARLQPGVGIADAQPVVKAVARRTQGNRTAQENPLQNATDVVALRGENEQGPDETMAAVTVFGTMLMLVLLVSTSTVSSLLVGLGMSRRHEIAVRRSLGASRARIVRQLLTETVLLALVAAALGLAAYAALCKWQSQQMVDVDIAPSFMTALGTALYAVAVALLCGLSPALHATRTDLSRALRDSSSGITAKSRLQRVFVVVQIAFSQPLLLGVAIAAVLAGHEMTAASGGWVAERIAVAELDVWANYSAERNAATIADLVPALSGLPGVMAALPTSTSQSVFSLEPKTDNSTGNASVATNTFRVRSTPTPARYFERVGVPMTQGREFTDADATAPVPRIILSSDAAVKLFGAGNPVGRHLYRVNGKRRQEEVEVVGVLGPSRESSWGNAPVLSVYSPLSLTDKGTIVTSIVIRTVGPAEPLLPTIRSVIHQRAPGIPIASIKTFAQIARQDRADMLQSSAAAAGAGLLTMLLGSIGLYAVVALGVAQRRREIGIRVALGARPRQVIGMFFGSGMRLSLLGMFIGLPLSAAAVWAVTGQVGRVRFNLPLISAGIAAAVMVIATLATWIPARRASNVDPLVALRTE